MNICCTFRFLYPWWIFYPMDCFIYDLPLHFCNLFDTWTLVCSCISTTKLAILTHMKQFLCIALYRVNIDKLSFLWQTSIFQMYKIYKRFDQYSILKYSVYWNNLYLTNFGNIACSFNKNFITYVRRIWAFVLHKTQNKAVCILTM